jgi:plasmid stability protein
MASITIRDLEPGVKERLRVRAARHGRSMEEEARVILRSAVVERRAPARGLGTAIHRRFKAIGGIDLELPERETMREPPRFR